MEKTATLSSKCQITLPADVRRKLGVGAHDKVTFVILDDRIEIKRPKYTLQEVLGSIKALPGESLDLEEEIYEATTEEINRKRPLSLSV